MDKGKGRLVDPDLGGSSDKDACHHQRPSPHDRSPASSGRPASQSWLSSLNEAQREAVTWSSQGSLQILAGPGSGKTRVLTSRVAYLVKECGIRAEDLIVVTFTNKAANEMKHRLRVLLGEQTVSKLVIGTFHSVAVRYLRRYGKAIDLAGNFVIADQGDCQSILKPIVEQHNGVLRERCKERGGASEEIKVKVAQEIISKSKAKGISPVRYLAEAESGEGQENIWKLAIAGIYTDYEAALRASNTLDFDDLLVFGERLLRIYPKAVENVQHVLVDEFQDTNTMQYEMVKLMAHKAGALTIVGDPDQSIYGWRSAEVENLAYMTSDFKNTDQIFLEENYRSTSSILEAALAVVQQDKERIDKSLRTSHPTGPPVVLRRFVNAQDEAAYIAYEIKRTIAQSGNTLNYNDFAILLRYNALSRAIEASLQSAGIPSRMVGGHKFFERAEVKDVLAYLQLADNPAYMPAFNRVINVPKRSIGEKSVKDIASAAKAKGMPCYEYVRKAVQGQITANIKPGQRANLGSFIKTISKVQEAAKAGTSVSELIDLVVDGINYKDHLERTYGAESLTRLENINELKSFADQIARDNATDIKTVQATVTRGGSRGDAIELLESDDVDEDDDVYGDTRQTVEQILDEQMNPLQTFLAASMLSTDTETQVAADDKSTAKVTISTCHAAKGLEWPVVFLPAAETGVYPAFRKSDNTEVAEERRLFYVAMTRAQALLHVTHADKRMERGQTEDKSLTEFVQPILTAKKVAFCQKALEFTSSIRASISAVAGRPPVDEAQMPSIMDSFHATTQAPTYTQRDDARFTSQLPPSHPQLNYASPTYPGQGWRINAYAGDQAKRYAATLPNRGTNKYAAAFATGPPPGFTSALSASRQMSTGGQFSTPSSAPTTSTSASISSVSSYTSISSSASTASSSSTKSLASVINAKSARPMKVQLGSFARPTISSGTSTLYKPFKPPTMVRRPQTGAPNVATVETRLTQQREAVILNPIAPNRPNATGYTLSSSKSEDFAFLSGLPADDDDAVAPRAPQLGKIKKRPGTPSSPKTSSSSSKKSRS